MPSFEKDWDFQDRLKPEITSALGAWLIDPASLKEDRQHNTDYCVHTAQLPGRGIVRFASRVRRNKWAKHPYLTQFTIRFRRPSHVETEYAKIRKGWGHYMLYAFAAINERSLMQWFIGDLDIFRAKDPEPIAIKPNKDKDPSDLAVFDLKQLPEEFVVHTGSAPAAIYDPMECPLCDRTGSLPSGLPCDHNDYDGQRLTWIRHYQKNYPPCSVCHAPMTIAAAQKLGHHLSCRQD